MDWHTRLAEARTFLFVPGNRPERFAKAAASGADAIVLDLEDSVPPDERVAARTALRESAPALSAIDCPVVVRVSAGATTDGARDRALLAHLPPNWAVMVAKAETVADLDLAVAPPRHLLPLVETARGWAGLACLAAAPQVLRLVLGHIDFLADTGLDAGEDERALDPLRFALAMHSRLHALPPPVDGVTVALDDPTQLAADTARALRFGFGAKLCIHPRQVAGVHAALRPTDAAIAHARRVIDADRAAQGRAVQLDGRMVDRPVVEQARRLLGRART